MRQHKILTRTLLILSIINFTLAAPAAVRRRPEVRPGASATGNVKATSTRKRFDDSDAPGGLGHAPPPSPDLWSQVVHIAQEVTEQHGHTDSPPPSLGRPESLTVPGYLPPMPGGPGHAPPPSPDIWSQMAQMAQEVAEQHGHMDSPAPSLNRPESLTVSDYFPPTPGQGHAPPSPDVWSQMAQMAQEVAEQHGHTDSPPPSLDNPGSLTVSDYVPPSPGSRLPVGSMPDSLSSHPPPFPYTSQLVPSEGRFLLLPGFSVNPNTLSSIGSQPTLPESPTRGPVTRPPPSPEPLPDQFWNTLLKGSGAPMFHTGPSEGRFPSPPGGSVDLDTSSSTGGQTPPPQSPARDPVTRPPPSPEPLPGEFWNTLLKGSGSPLLHPRPSEDHFPSPPGGLVSSSTGGQTPPPQSPARDPVTRLPPSPEPLPDQFWNALLKDSNSPQLHPGPSEGHFPSSPGRSVNPNTLSSTGGPPPPPSPEHNPVTHPPPSSEQSLADEFWDALLKGKIKRRISGPLP